MQTFISLLMWWIFFLLFFGKAYSAEQKPEIDDKMRLHACVVTTDTKTKEVEMLRAELAHFKALVLQNQIIQVLIASCEKTGKTLGENGFCVEKPKEKK